MNSEVKIIEKKRIEGEDVDGLLTKARVVCCWLG